MKIGIVVEMHEFLLYYIYGIQIKRDIAFDI